MGCEEKTGRPRYYRRVETTSNLLSTPAFWSAVAASCSAFAAFIMALIHRRNLIESVRPVIMLDNWERRRKDAGSLALDQILFKAVRNVGRGPALYVYMNAFTAERGLPQGGMSTWRAAIIPNSDRVEIDNPITLFFQNAGGEPGHRLLPLRIDIFFRDIRGRAHLTHFEFLVAENPNQAPGDHVAPGVIFATWDSRTETVARRKMRKQMRRVPWLRRFTRVD